MPIGDHMCIFPFVSGPCSHSKSTGLDKNSVATNGMNDTNKVVDTDFEAMGSKSIRKRRTVSKDDSLSEHGSSRVSFSKLVIFLRNAYIITMKSFATKPGGLGGMVVGGNVELPGATPMRVYRDPREPWEPRNFVRSRSQPRPPQRRHMIDFEVRANPHVAIDFEQRMNPHLAMYNKYSTDNNDPDPSDLQATS